MDTPAPIRIDFDAAITEQLDALITTYAPKLPGLLTVAPDEQIQQRIRDLAALITKLRNEPYRSYISVVAAEATQLVELCERHDDADPALLETLRALGTEARALAHANWRARTDAAHVNRALRILVARNPAAHDAAAAVLAPYPASA
ncbi:hypothetical protein [Amycolatopsis sp. DSM 110486]|uniref:hypothetical protein n=1 Tax=Amycolatopsis sp. DSM 110486 TaxID=2865832 RepID=UPI001C6A5722|nr:hypothetical protein [Amycolatopsis sp. DSM 110486]QYN23161.1 hypothetical protein K1T34_12285 [Amycolatopsis sp. DSM 110486]